MPSTISGRQHIATNNGEANMFREVHGGVTVQGDVIVGGADATFRQASDPRRLLPYLIDRAGVMGRVRSGLRTVDRTEPLICIIHGHADQCSDTLFDRLVERDLPSMLRLEKDKGVSEYSLRWPRDVDLTSDSLEALFGRLNENLSQAVLGYPVEDRQEIVETFEANAGPTAIYTQRPVRSRSNAAGDAIRFVREIEAYLKYWSGDRWKIESGPVVVLLSLVYLSKERDVISELLAPKLAELEDANECLVVTDKLANVTIEDALDWNTEQRISQMTLPITNGKLVEIFETSDAMSMQEWADSVSQIWTDLR